MEIRPDSQYVSTTPPPAAAPAQPPAVESSPAMPQDFVDINVPMRIPTQLVTPDAQGNVPLSSYQPKLVPLDAIITNQTEVQSLVETVRKQTLPPGTHPEIDNSKAGNAVDKGKQVITKLSNTAGGLGVYSLMSPGGALSFLSIPAAVAAPLATVGGVIGVLGGLDQTKQALNLKGYYENLKTQGVETVAVPQPVKTKEGIQMQMVDMPVDTVIKSARDQAVVGGMMTASSVLMAAAGIAAGATIAPALAVASIAVSVGTVVYALHGKVAELAQHIWDKITGHGAEDGGAQQPVPATSPPPQEAQPTEFLVAGEKPK